MYPPASQVIKTQTFTRQKGREPECPSKVVVVFPQNSSNSNSQAGGRHQKKTGKEIENKESIADNPRTRPPAWNTNGSTGSTAGSTSPSISSPLSRTSSVGSDEDERLGASIARQGAIINAQNIAPPSPVIRPPNKNVAQPKNTPQGLSPRTSQPVASPSRTPKSAGKPFNHREVIEHMNREFQEAKKAIQSGRGKVYDPRDHGSPVEFTPFDWEEFWKQRMMKNI